MSPLRRAWLAWYGWELLVVAGWLLIYAVLVTAALSIPGDRYRPLDERPFAFLLLMPLLLGLRLRRLLTTDTLALARNHAAWVLRWFFLAILPVAILGVAVPLALTGIPPLWAVAVAACLMTVGAWLGFALLWSIPAFTVSLILIFALGLISARDGWIGNLIAIAALLLVAFCVRIAWRRLKSRPVPAWTGWRSPRLDAISAWFDEYIMSRPSPVAASGRLPTLATAARLGLSGLGGSWLLRLIGMLGMAIGAFALSSQAPGSDDRLSALLCVATLMACALAPGWLSTGKGDAPLASGQARHQVRGLLAGERLRPLSRRRAAAATLLAITGNCLSSVLPMTGGMMLGLVLADLWRGRDSTGLWLLLPQAVAITICSAAGMILIKVIHPTVAIVSATALGAVLLGAPIVAINTGTGDSYPSVTIITVGLAVLLAPLAWYRLSEAELP